MHSDVYIVLTSCCSTCLGAGRCVSVLSPLIVCNSTMAATGPEDRAEEGPGGAAVCPPGLQACTSTTTHSSNEPDMQNTLVRNAEEPDPCL